MDAESAIRVGGTHEPHGPTEKLRPWRAEGSAREPLDQPVRRGHSALNRTGCRPPAASTIAEADAEDRLVPDSLSPVEGTAPSCHRTGTPVKGSATVPPNVRHFAPIFPPFEHDRPGHGLTARTADRAVLVRLRRFIAGIHAILETPDKREGGSSSLPKPI